MFYSFAYFLNFFAYFWICFIAFGVWTMLFSWLISLSLSFMFLCPNYSHPFFPWFNSYCLFIISYFLAFVSYPQARHFKIILGFSFLFVFPYSFYFIFVFIFYFFRALIDYISLFFYCIKNCKNLYFVEIYFVKMNLYSSFNYINKTRTPQKINNGRMNKSSINIKYF